jgi:hypothetical protein
MGYFRSIGGFGVGTLVLPILGGMDSVLKVGSYSRLQNTTLVIKKGKDEIYQASTHLSYLYQGGGDYRGIYDIGFKRGFYGVYRPFIEGPLQER